MKKMSKKELIEKVIEIEKQIKDKKVKLAFRTLLTKYTKDPKSLKIKDIEAILELANNDGVFLEEKPAQKAEKKTSKKEEPTKSKKTSKKIEKAPKKEVKKSEVEIDYTKIFSEKVNCSELEKNHFFRKTDLSFEKIRELFHSGDDDVFLISHWSQEELKKFNYSGTREVPEELCESFENDLDILKVVYVERYKDVLFAESVLTGATFTFFKTDFEKDAEKGCRLSEGLPFEIYVIEETKPEKGGCK